MSSLDECGGQFTIIVNLAVEDYPDRAILVGEGLVAGIEVDDAEASHPDTQRCGRVDATSVRAPGSQRLAHLAEHFAICGGRTLRSRAFGSAGRTPCRGGSCPRRGLPPPHHLTLFR